MHTGYRGKILIINLDSGNVREEQLEERLYRDYIGGVGLGVKLIYERQSSKVDPLGKENILGFMPGLLGGTAVPCSSRLTVVSKSPLTGGWGDSSVGGHIGSELKCAGYDGILFKGISPKPVYLLVYKDKVELRDASRIWGLDTAKTEEMLRKELLESKLKVICIGPAGENLSLISSIIHEGRAAGRAGLGAVMGSKRLKAIAVHSQNMVPVADTTRIQLLQRQFIKEIKESKVKFINAIKTTGTAGDTDALIAMGNSPIKNWSLNGQDNMPSDRQPYGPNINKYLARRTSCAGCPVGCKGILKLQGEDTGKTARPEYETVVSFGPMCLNVDSNSIIAANDICNRYGMDTMSAGTTIAFALECYERGIITKKDTDGINLTWGNSSAILAILEKMVKREGFGTILADGVKRAAERIGHGASEYAIHVGGQEPGFHDPRLSPARGTGYMCDPTPGRHTAFMAGGRIESGMQPGPYPEIWGKPVELHDYKHKAPIYGPAIKYEQVVASAGLCKFVMPQGTFPLVEFIAAATGWDFSSNEILVTGERIQDLRQLFNIREGIDPNDFQLPNRISQPPSTGPHKDSAPLDFDVLRSQYYQAMGWNPKTGYPSKSRLKELGLI